MKMWKTLVLMIAVGLVLAPVATADWLVMKDGSRVEAPEGWKIEGKRVVFTSTRGTLSMVRLSEVDMEATEAAEAAAAQAVAPEPELEAAPKPPPVLVLTDADIPRARPEETAAPTETLPAVADREPVQIVDWSHREVDGGGIEILGRVRNTGEHMATKITVRADIKEDDGELVTDGTAFLGTDTLLAGNTTSFRLMLPDIDILYGTPTFVVTSDAISLGTGREKMAAIDTARDADASDADSGDEEPGPN